MAGFAANGEMKKYKKLLIEFILNADKNKQSQINNKKDVIIICKWILKNINKENFNPSQYAIILSQNKNCLHYM